MILPTHQIRAYYTDKIIRVYQAYSDDIADSALKHNTFASPPFKLDRMTWIKPSFLWMMYRSGWAQKDANQKRILAIDIDRNGFEWALKNGCLSHKPEYLNNEEWKTHKNRHPVRIQWDPERNMFLEPLPYRTIQIGLSNEAVSKYVNEWVQQITDITQTATDIKKLIDLKEFEKATNLFPIEKIYPYSFIENAE
jgi:hypothetical protein